MWLGGLYASEAVLAGGDIPSSSSWSYTNCHVVVAAAFFSYGDKPLFHIPWKVLISAYGAMHVDWQSVAEESDSPRGVKSPLCLLRKFHEAVDVGISIIVFQFQFLEGCEGIFFFGQVGEL